MFKTPQVSVVVNTPDWSPVDYRVTNKIEGLNQQRRNELIEVYDPRLVEVDHQDLMNAFAAATEHSSVSTLDALGVLQHYVRSVRKPEHLIPPFDLVSKPDRREQWVSVAEVISFYQSLRNTVECAAQAVEDENGGEFFPNYPSLTVVDTDWEVRYATISGNHAIAVKACPNPSLSEVSMVGQLVPWVVEDPDLCRRGGAILAPAKLKDALSLFMAAEA